MIVRRSVLNAESSFYTSSLLNTLINSRYFSIQLLFFGSKYLLIRLITLRIGFVTDTFNMINVTKIYIETIQVDYERNWVN